MSPFLIQLIGITAPAFFLYAYAMVSLGKWPSTTLKFHALNFIGGVLILISLIAQWNLPVFIMEVCWCSISLYGIMRILLQKRQTSSDA